MAEVVWAAALVAISRYRELVRKRRTLGCVELPRRGGGSHRKWHPAALMVVPGWGGRDLIPGAVRPAARQLGSG